MQFASVRRLGLAGAALLVLEITACSGSEDTNSPSTAQGSQTATVTSGTSGPTSAATTGTTVGGTTATSGTTSGTTGAGSTSTGSTSATTATTTGAGTTTTGSITTGTTSTTGAGGSSTSSTTTESATTTTGGTSNAVVSDDFESVAAGSPPDAAIWQLRLPAGSTNSIEISSEQAHGGSQSVKVVGNSGSTLFFTEDVFPLPSGVLHFRVWVRFTEGNWANHNAFVASGPGSESQEIRFGGQNNAYHANLSEGDGLSPDPYESPACERCVAPVANEWTCLRGKLDYTNNAAELYVGEALAVDSAADGWHNGASAAFPASPTQIGFGWALYGAMANTVYYDDLAIGYEAIACE